MTNQTNPRERKGVITLTIVFGVMMLCVWCRMVFYYVNRGNLFLMTFVMCYVSLQVLSSRLTFSSS